MLQSRHNNNIRLQFTDAATRVYAYLSRRRRCYDDAIDVRQHPYSLPIIFHATLFDSEAAADTPLLADIFSIGSAYFNAATLFFAILFSRYGHAACYRRFAACFISHGFAAISPP